MGAEFTPEQLNLLCRFIFVVEIMTPTSHILLGHRLFKKGAAVTSRFWNGLSVASLWGGHYRTPAAPFSSGLTDCGFLCTAFLSEGVYHGEKQDIFA